MQNIKPCWKEASVFFAIVIVVVLLYFPILQNGFLSDDYDSLFRIIIEKRILFRGFFRPMIDISFLLNYFITGLSPIGYYIFNLVIHIFNGYMLFRFARRFPLFTRQKQEIFALISCLLFLVYPFHNEAVVWLSGRLSSMAFFWAILCLNIYLSNLKLGTKNFLCILCYLAGLLCYESIFLLPAMLLVIDLGKSTAKKSLILQTLIWLGVALLYLLIRFYFSGTIYGDYGDRLTPGIPLISYFSTVLKVAGRLLLPPYENSRKLMIMFLSLCSLISFLHFYLFKNQQFRNIYLKRYAELLLLLLISLVIPFYFGVSTRTTEGDRLLYFPSCFYCMILSFLIISIFNNSWTRGFAFFVVFALFALFLEKNNRQWIIASGAASDILQSILKSKKESITIINLPDELEGAFVFRNGFRKALRLNNIESSRVIVTNYLNRLDYLKIADTISPVKERNSWFIYPVTRINEQRLDSMKMDVYYWNKKSLQRLF